MAEAVAGAAFDVSLGALVMAFSHEHDGVDRAVGLAIAAAVESVTAALAG